MKIFAVNCPSCENETPISVKDKERLKEMEINCTKCDWKGIASEGIICEKEFDDWF